LVVQSVEYGRPLGRTGRVVTVLYIGKWPRTTERYSEYGLNNGWGAANEHFDF
jgi:hypothetical protein